MSEENLVREIFTPKVEKEWNLFNSSEHGGCKASVNSLG